MNVIRWIFGPPIGVALLLGLNFVFTWLLGWLYKVMYYIIMWGSRFDHPTYFDFEKQIDDFKVFIFVTCLSTLLSAGCAGYIGGAICPPKHFTAKAILFGIIILPFLVLSTIGFWKTQSLVYSIAWTIDMLIVLFIFAGCSTIAGNNEDYENNY